MITYLLESTFILAITYGFYFFFLRQLKTFAFNRFYLLFSVFFALLIPRLEIRVGFSAPVTQGLNGLGYATGQLIQGNANVEATPSTLSLIQLVILLYALISAIFLLRFLANVVRIIRKTRGAILVSELNTQVCLVEEPTLPYSFFRRINWCLPRTSQSLIRKCW